MTTLVFYVEETLEDGNLDLRACVTYDGLDTYSLYSTRDSKHQFRLEFLSRESLACFLTNSVDETSKLNVTLYTVDESQMNFNNFSCYYESYNFENELYGYDNLTYKEYSSSVRNNLMILRDARLY
jgi:hypothetical protein